MLARLNPNYLANENVDQCLTSVGGRLGSGKLMGWEEIHREQDNGHQEDQRADDPHYDCANNLIGHGRYVEWVWLPGGRCHLVRVLRLERSRSGGQVRS